MFPSSKHNQQHCVEVLQCTSTEQAVCLEEVMLCFIHVFVYVGSSLGLGSQGLARQLCTNNYERTSHGSYELLCKNKTQQTTLGQEKDMQSAEVNSCAGLGVIDLIDSKFRWQVSTCVTGFFSVFQIKCFQFN